MSRMYHFGFYKQTIQKHKNWFFEWEQRVKPEVK